MPLRVGLNGAGRIGRALFRILRDDRDVALVAVNDVAGAETIAHLTRHDSIYGAFPGTVEPAGDTLALDGRVMRFTVEADPRRIPWRSARAEVIVEATGRFAKNAGARGHLRGGVKRVLVTAVAPEADSTVVLGVHDGAVDDAARVISTGSCTTHAAALPLALLDRWYGIAAAEMTTVHCTTGSQVTMDLPHADPRRARSALLSMIPTSTSARHGIVAALPQLAGRLSCLAVRVPTASVSLVEITAATRRRLDAPEALAARFRDAAARPPFAGRLGVCDEPLVSVDFKGSPYTSVIDLPLLTRTTDRFVRVVAWYDNEWGYASRVADLLRVWAATQVCRVRGSLPIRRGPCDPGKARRPRRT